MLPWYTRTRVLVDAANGVITDDFYNRTLTPDGVWGVWENLAPELQSAFSSGADQITVELFKSLAWNYPGARFGQYTTAFDEVQIGFFNLARNTDRPDLWEDPNELALSAFEWTIRARTYMNLVAFQTWNYRYYIAAGGDHTVVGSDKFYTEDSAAGASSTDYRRESPESEIAGLGVVSGTDGFRTAGVREYTCAEQDLRAGTLECVNSVNSAKLAACELAAVNGLRHVPGEEPEEALGQFESELVVMAHQFDGLVDARVREHLPHGVRATRAARGKPLRIGRAAQRANDAVSR